jgi:hypothetical protein
VTDDAGLTATAQQTVTVANVAPSATFGAPASSSAGFPFTLSLSGVSDPSAADMAAGFTYAFDCGDGSGYGAFGSSASTSCPTTDVGVRSVGGKVRDKNGGIREYTATVNVTVTFDSLCALVRSYARRPSDADALCAKLAEAAAGDKENKLSAFRSMVDAKTGPGPGKSFTAEQGALLKLLSRRL